MTGTARTIGAVVRWIIFAVVLGFVAYALWKQIVQIDWRTVRFRPLPLVAAFVCLALVPPVQLLSYRTLLGAYAHELGLGGEIDGVHPVRPVDRDAREMILDDEGDAHAASLQRSPESTPDAISASISPGS